MAKSNSSSSRRFIAHSCQTPPEALLINISGANLIN
jgi:hypothetical protein